VPQRVFGPAGPKIPKKNPLKEIWGKKENIVFSPPVFFAFKKKFFGGPLDPGPFSTGFKAPFG